MDKGKYITGTPEELMQIAKTNRRRIEAESNDRLKSKVKASVDLISQVKIEALTEFVDSLKEWCDGHDESAEGLLEFAVQRLELIKEGK